MNTISPFSTVYYQTLTLTTILHNLVEGLLYIPHLQKTFVVTDIQNKKAVLIKETPTIVHYISTAMKIIPLILFEKTILSFFAALVVIDRLCHRFVTQNSQKDYTWSVDWKDQKVYESQGYQIKNEGSTKILEKTLESSERLFLLIKALVKTVLLLGVGLCFVSSVRWEWETVWNGKGIIEIEKSMADKIAHGVFNMTAEDIKAKKGAFSQVEKIEKSLQSIYPSKSNTTCEYLLDFEKSGSEKHYLSNGQNNYLGFVVQQIDDSYSYALFDKIIGKGGNNTVYLGYDLTNNEPVVFREYKSFSQEAYPSSTFENERKIHQTFLDLGIPNIVKMHHFSSRKQNDWVEGTSNQSRQGINVNAHQGLMLEYCSEGDLLVKLKDKNHPLTLDQKKKILYELLRTVKALHENNYVHADLKLANILLKGNGEIRVADLDCTGKINDLNLYFTVIYMAPENIRKPHQFDEGFNSEHTKDRYRKVCWNSLKKTKENDLWACGVVALRLFNDQFQLEGISDNIHPFSEKCKIISETIHNIPETVLEWSKTNPEDPYIKVIVGLLNPNPNERLSAEKALELLS